MLEQISSTHFHLVIGIALFSLGALGVLFKRSILVVLMCVELMLNGVNLVLVTFNRMHGGADGYAMVFFSILVAAAEAGVGLSLLVTLFRMKGYTDIDQMTELRN
jgi:NADH-quinone oxidoreductase subunit K